MSQLTVLRFNKQIAGPPILLMYNFSRHGTFDRTCYLGSNFPGNLFHVHLRIQPIPYFIVCKYRHSVFHGASESRRFLSIIIRQLLFLSCNKIAVMNQQEQQRNPGSVESPLQQESLYTFKTLPVGIFGNIKQDADTAECKEE